MLRAFRGAFDGGGCPVAVAVWFGAAVVGCGGETSRGSACGGVDACGGDLTGDWKVTLECAAVAPSSPLLGSSGSSLPDACKSAISQAINTAQYDAVDVTASFSGTQLHETGSLAETVRLDLPSACMRALGATTVDLTACNQAAGAMQASQGDSACTVTNGGCSCTLTLSAPIDVTGTYRIEGNRFVSASGVSSDYCVSGNTATIFESGLGLSGRLRLTRVGEVGDAGP